MDKIIVIIIGVLFLMSMAIASDTPIVSDRSVGRTDSLRVVTKDDLQVIFRNMSDRIQNLENRVARLEQTSQGGQ